MLEVEFAELLGLSDKQYRMLERDKGTMAENHRETAWLVLNKLFSFSWNEMIRELETDSDNPVEAGKKEKPLWQRNIDAKIDVACFDLTNYLKERREYEKKIKKGSVDS